MVYCWLWAYAGVCPSSRYRAAVGVDAQERRVRSATVKPLLNADLAGRTAFTLTLPAEEDKLGVAYRSNMIGCDLSGPASALLPPAPSSQADKSQNHPPPR